MWTRKQLGAITQWWKSLTDLDRHGPGVTRRTGARQTPRRRALGQVERLEARTLLACDAWIDLGGFGLGDEVLRVEGDARNNAIRMSWEPGEVDEPYYVDFDCDGDGDFETWEKFNASDIPAGISVRGLGGADQITVDSSVVIGVVIDGGRGNDMLIGGNGGDTIRGGADHDSIYGQDGNDVMEGQGGNDTLNGGSGGDDFNGGTGTDTADYSGRVENLTIDLDDSADDGAAGEGDNVRRNVENVWGGRGNDRITGSDSGNELRGNYGDDTLNGLGGVDNLYGGQGNDQIDGGNGNDRLWGDAGRDSLKGGADNDYMLGGTENDTLEGGAGRDSMYGESGDDTLYARDNEVDGAVDGGLDNDVCRADARDPVANC